jgi:hypothetical protein
LTIAPQVKQIDKVGAKDRLQTGQFIWVAGLSFEKVFERVNGENG